MLSGNDLLILNFEFLILNYHRIDLWKTCDELRIKN